MQIIMHLLVGLVIYMLYQIKYNNITIYDKKLIYAIILISLVNIIMSLYGDKLYYNVAHNILKVIMPEYDIDYKVGIIHYNVNISLALHHDMV